MIEEDYTFFCPHCGSEMSIRVEPGGGQRQSFVYDCETCCRPIQIRIDFDGDEIINFSAESEE